MLPEKPSDITTPLTVKGWIELLENEAQRVSRSIGMLATIGAALITIWGWMFLQLAWREGDIDFFNLTFILAMGIAVLFFLVSQESKEGVFDKRYKLNILRKLVYTGSMTNPDEICSFYFHMQSKKSLYETKLLRYSMEEAIKFTESNIQNVETYFAEQRELKQRKKYYSGLWKKHDKLLKKKQTPIENS
ncbi:MAG: hypothetical protein L6265_07620 [Thermoplasmatales archaeon]|nr:hypothetical protein [Thermoplasmatales archaeon]